MSLGDAKECCKEIFVELLKEYAYNFLGSAPVDNCPASSITATEESLSPLVSAETTTSDYVVRIVDAQGYVVGSSKQIVQLCLNGV